MFLSKERWQHSPKMPFIIFNFSFNLSPPLLSSLLLPFNVSVLLAFLTPLCPLLLLAPVFFSCLGLLSLCPLFLPLPFFRHLTFHLFSALQCPIPASVCLLVFPSCSLKIPADNCICSLTICELGHYQTWVSGDFGQRIWIPWPLKFSSDVMKGLNSWSLVCVILLWNLCDRFYLRVQ